MATRARAIDKFQYSATLRGLSYKRHEELEDLKRISSNPNYVDSLPFVSEYNSSLTNPNFKGLRKRIEDLKRKRKAGGLEKTAVTTAIIGFIGSIFFLSNNITGNVIGNLTNSTSDII